MLTKADYKLNFFLPPYVVFGSWATEYDFRSMRGN